MSSSRFREGWESVSDTPRSEDRRPPSVTKTLRKSRPQNAQGSWFFVHDNARPHTANIVKQFLAKKRRGVHIEHPPFTPDLNPPYFFLFRRVELPLKGKILDNSSDIQRNVTRLLNSFSKGDFLQNFQDMYNRTQQSIVKRGDYFKGQ
ncbi:UNVERIFIED_CONTAM: Histone-lysine N-methyltransferase SETMAR [Trichonephila clavipes]